MGGKFEGVGGIENCANPPMPAVGEGFITQREITLFALEGMDPVLTPLAFQAGLPLGQMDNDIGLGRDVVLNELLVSILIDRIPGDASWPSAGVG
jgi:hypothetical protein